MTTVENSTLVEGWTVAMMGFGKRIYVLKLGEGGTMRMKLIGSLLIIVLLCGCSRMHSNPFRGQVSIDWVDFVKLNGNSYMGLWEHVINNPSDVTDVVVGKVKFKVADVVTNPDYRTKAGDAGFLEKGTLLYQINGFKDDELIAAKDETRIGGYRLYAEEDFMKTMQHHYNDVPKDKVERVELYHNYEVKPYKALYNKDKEQFIKLLDSGKDTQNYTPNNQEGDPSSYTMVFYTDEPIAYAYYLADDGVNVYFSPWDTRIVALEIRNLLQ
jgi:hypothetical protein